MRSSSLSSEKDIFNLEVSMKAEKIIHAQFQLDSASQSGLYKTF